MSSLTIACRIRPRRATSSTWRTISTASAMDLGFTSMAGLSACWTSCENSRPVTIVHHSSTTKATGSMRQSKLEFWHALKDCSFALAPAGYGVDTHRVYEILMMHTAPIVLTSPLDALYAQFPVIVVSTWSEVFVPGAPYRFKKYLMDKFGVEPFNNSTVTTKLSMEYWVTLINRAHSQQ